ncbi:MAG: ATP-binding cassette domain-containing protein [Fusobacteriaceae bacterium]
MAILTVSNVCKYFSSEKLFSNINFSIESQDKIGLIGVNGAGKTTLIKILLGLEEDDINFETNIRGNISKKSGLQIGYLSQNSNLNEDMKVFDELMLHLEKHVGEDELAEEYRVRQILNGLSLPENIWHAKISDLSGGQVSRVALAKILLIEPELLILDEPTNHLDLPAIEWLEKFLKNYKKTFILISHDIIFLDNVTSRIFEMEGKTLVTYGGNYSSYKIQKEAFLSGAIKSFEKEQDKIKKTEEFIRKYKAGIKSKQARGREKILNRMEKMDNPIIPVRKIRLKFRVGIQSGEKVLKISQLSKSFGSLQLFTNLNLEIFRGDRIGVIGKNGVGKSTLLKIINNLETQTSGQISIGEKVKIGFYDQNHSSLTEKNSILEELMGSSPLTYEEARTFAGGFLFTNEEIEKKISVLSGGEKSRVEFMKLILAKPNFLILDEPTNHLDIYSREILEEALEGYEGTLIVVSHDRYFLESVVNSVYEINQNGANLFKGDYDSYINQKEIKIKKSDAPLDYNEQKKLNSKINSVERRIKKLEEDMEKVETQKKSKEEEYILAGKNNNLESLLKIQEDLDNFENQLLEIIQEWDEKQKELSEIEELSRI